MDPRNAGPLVFIWIGLALVIVFLLVGIVWLSVGNSNERARCSNLVAGADLSACSPVIGRIGGNDLSGADFSEAELGRKDLSDATLTAADFTNANLREADLSGADLSGADLTGADLTRAKMTDADLTGAILTDVIWDRTTCPNGQRTISGNTC